MEYSITNNFGANVERFTTFQPAGTVDPVTDRSCQNWDCIDLPIGTFYSTSANVTFQYYFVYDGAANTVQYMKYGTVIVNGHGVTTRDSIHFSFTEMKSGMTSLCTFTCPVKVVDKNKIVFQIYTKTYPITKIRREMNVGNGECILQRRVYFNFDNLDRINYYYAISDKTCFRTHSTKPISKVIFLDHSQKVEINYHLDSNGLQVKFKGVMCCEGDLYLRINLEQNNRYTYNQNSLAFVGEHSGLSIVKYDCKYATAKLVLLHVHPANFEFTLVNL